MGLKAHVWGGGSNTHPVYTSSIERDLDMINTKKMYAVIDWVSLTFDCPENDSPAHFIEQILEHLNLRLNQFTGCNSNKGYQYALDYQGFLSFHFDQQDEERLDRGIHFNITGQGCRFIETHMNNFSWQTFFKVMETLGLRNVTRLDLALDDYKKRLDISELWQKWQAKEVITKIRKARYIESSDWTVEGDLGKTLYIGNPKRMQFRFYDKLQERRAKGQEVDEKIKSWQRYEIQVRHEQALELMHKIIETKNIGEIALGLFSDYLSVRDENVFDKNRSRWPISDFWNAFLGAVKRVHLAMTYPEPTLPKTQAWHEKAVSKSLAKIQLYLEDGFQDYLEKLLELGQEKLEDSDIEQVKYQIEYDYLLGKNKMSFEQYHLLSFA